GGGLCGGGQSSRHSRRSGLCPVADRESSGIGTWNSGSDHLADHRGTACLARSFGESGGRDLKRVDCLAQQFDPAFYFRRVCKTRAHVPPNARQPTWHNELFFKFSKNVPVAVGLKERNGQREPLPRRPLCDQVEQKNAEIVGVSLGGRE